MQMPLLRYFKTFLQVLLISNAIVFGVLISLVLSLAFVFWVSIDFELIQWQLVRIVEFILIVFSLCIALDIESKKIYP